MISVRKTRARTNIFRPEETIDLQVASLYSHKNFLENFRKAVGNFWETFRKIGE